MPSLKSVHRYLGLGLSLVMLIISVTGVLLVWKKEYLALTIADAGQAIDQSQLAAAIERIEATYPVDHVRFIQLYSEGLALHKVFLTDKRYAWHNQSGQQLQVWTANERFEDWLLDLHHRFLLGNTIGLNIAGFGGLLLLPLLLLGFLIWWPRRRTIKLGLVPTSLHRGSLLRSHGNLGAVFALPILLIGVTGVILVYPTESRTVLIDHFAKSQPPVLESIKLEAEPNADISSWAVLLNEAQRRFPNSWVRWVQPASEKYPDRVIGLQQQAEWNRTGKSSVRFSVERVLTLKNALDQPGKVRLFDFSYPLHTGKLALWYRLLLSLVGVALAALCVLGVLSFSRPK